jgi:glycosyltransferase involved in cell wall biosynthesis
MAGRLATPQISVVIPAHNEAPNVAATVASCRTLAYDPAGYRVIVVAGRGYLAAARSAADANPSGIVVSMDDWMRPAVKNQSLSFITGPAR